MKQPFTTFASPNYVSQLETDGTESEHKQKLRIYLCISLSNTRICFSKKKKNNGEEPRGYFKILVATWGSGGFAFIKHRALTDCIIYIVIVRPTPNFA